MKTALITGGSQGIGKQLVETFKAEGYLVYSTYFSSAPRNPEANEIPLPFDLSDPKSHDALYEKLPASIDLLINNAGLGSATVARRSTDKRTQDLFLLQVNALGALWLTEEILTRMRKQGHGKIIHISSVGGGIFHYPGFRLADGMSKAALTFMGKQLASECVFDNIQMFTVCPGATDTDMFYQSTLKSMTHEARKLFLSKLPGQRMIQPKEIAELCRFLSTDAANALHGAVLDASLGLGVRPSCLS